MLNSLRNASRSWVAKALLLLLVASFGIWGVSTSLVATDANTVMTVGDQEVSAQEFALAYQRHVAALGRQFGMQLTPEQVRAFGIDQQVYSQLTAGAALDQLSDDMGLGLSHDRLAMLIAEDPAFQGSNGQFDRNLFTSRLRNAGLREDDYITERSQVAVRSQIVEAVSDGFQPPQVMLDALKQYRDETRSVDYLLLSNANIAPVKAPTNDVLAAWFEGVKARYRAPEYRTFTYVTLQPSDLADPSSISEEEARAEYEKRKDSFTTRGTRTIEQLTYPSREMAEAAATQLREGSTTFDQLVADQGKTASDVLLGEFTKENIPDPTLADAAFAVSSEGGTTDVIDGAFGPVILRVTNVTSETTRSFEEVESEIRQQLALQVGSQQVLDAHDRFEEIRAGGATLEEAARELNLKAVTVTADASGTTPQDEKIENLPTADTLLTDVFRSEPGAQPLPVSLGNNGYVWFEVSEVTPERDRTLDEVRERVVADWTAEQQREALGARATELKQRVEGGATLAAVAEDLGIAVETKQGLRRNAEDAIFGPEAVNALFAGPVGLVTTAVGADGESQLLIKVTGSDLVPADALSNQEPLQRLAQAAGDDMLDQMVNRLQNDYGVSINQAVAEQVANSIR
ncbi:peptidyl-prolyl cis-trans isomerase D [Pseudorhizobium tarimense]|uniref:Parvulin-like PPIase n=1 Tax=Pseudorhizobium tarimense TaxID=1079109 RepID=A0ABV2HCN5_9HYPH|nr:peptidylprolyl isomerase [Pseudorhizobium tarimense]MCJ8521276.1 SurA N-terminal domain-containing protein [Pseudorhizobium tarimense]